LVGSLRWFWGLSGLIKKAKSNLLAYLLSFFVRLWLEQTQPSKPVTQNMREQICKGKLTDWNPSRIERTRRQTALQYQMPCPEPKTMQISPWLCRLASDQTKNITIANKLAIATHDFMTITHDSSQWLNDFNIWSMKYCAVKLFPCGRRSIQTKPFGFKKRSTMISRPRWFDEPVLGAPRPNSTSILSDNFSIILRTHHQCRTPFSSSAMPSQARPAAKQQVLLLLVSDRRSICGDPSPVTKFQMKNLSEDIEYRFRGNARTLSNVSNWSIGRCFECSLDFEMSLEIWRSSAGSLIFISFSPHAKLPHPITYITIRECLVSIMFNQLRIDLRRPMTLFPETFDKGSLLHGFGYGKRTEDV
jgi:hypothetical protein